MPCYLFIDYRLQTTGYRLQAKGYRLQTQTKACLPGLGYALAGRAKSYSLPAWLGLCDGRQVQVVELH